MEAALEDRSFSMLLRYSAGFVEPMQRISPRLRAPDSGYWPRRASFRRFTRPPGVLQLVDEDDEFGVGQFTS